MIGLIKNEWQRSFKSKSSIIYILIIVMFSSLMGWYLISGTEADVLNPDGTLTIIKGEAAVKQLVEYEKTNEGEITEDKLKNGLNNYRDSFNAVRDEFNYNLSLLENIPLVGMVNGLLYQGKDIIPFKYSGFIKDIPDEVASDYYKTRETMLINKLNKKYGSEKIINKILERENKIKKPFIYYAGYSPWETAFEYLALVFVIILILSILFTSPIFSKSYEDGSYDIICTTKYGREHLTKAKLIVSFIYSILLYIIGVGVFMAILFSSLNIEALKTSIQVMSPFSSAAMDFKGILILMLVSGIMGILSMAAITVFISSKAKTTSQALILALASFFIYEFVYIAIKPNSRLVNLLLNIFPVSGIHMIYSIHDYDFLNIGGILMWIPYFILSSCIICFLLFGFLTTKQYAYRR